MRIQCACDLVTETTKSKKSEAAVAQEEKVTRATRAYTVRLREGVDPHPPGDSEPEPEFDKATTAELPDIEPLPYTDPEGEAPFGRDDTVSRSLEEFIAPSRIGAKACLIVMRGHQVGRMYELTDGTAEIGRSHDMTISIADDAVSRRHAKVHSSSLGFVVTDLDSTNGLFVNAERVQERVLRDGDRIQFGTSTVIKFAFQDELEESLQQKLYDSATRDQLVGAHNRQYLVDNLEAAFAAANRHGRPLSVLMLDIDHFKRVNDTFGHPAGDDVLKGVAGIIEETKRGEDVFARVGGEEFVLLLPESTREGSVLVAERIRETLEHHVIDYDGNSIKVTISIGVATYSDHNYPTPQALLGAADAGLYEAKRGGRNRVVWSQRAAPPQSREAGDS